MTQVIVLQREDKCVGGYRGRPAIICLGIPAMKSSFRLVSAMDSIVIFILGWAWLAGKINGIVLGPVNVAVGIATVISGVLVLAEEIGLLTGRWACSGWSLLVVVLVVGLAVNL